MMLLALAAAACLPVGGPKITAKDIAAAVPGYAASSDAPDFGYSPTPNVKRVVHPAELQQYLKRQDFTGAMPVADVCFERPTAVLTADAVKAAMQQTLGVNAHIEVVEVSRFPAPIGPPTFERSGLGNPPIALWHGYVAYDGDKRFPIWARVKVTMPVTRIVATEDLRPGTPIQLDQVEVKTSDEFPGARSTPSNIAKVIGALPRRFLSAGTPLWEDAIDPPNQITKGDRVSITVHSGFARLVFDAEAETSGRAGETISFKNPESGKLFRARVAGPDQALVDTPSAKP